MSKLSMSLAAVLLLVLAGWQSDTKTRFVFTEASTLWVTGTSTIHDWRCDAVQVDGWLDAEAGETPAGIAGAEVTVRAEGLECKNGTMNKKTRKALQTDAYPTIRYQLTAAEVRPGTAKTFHVEATGRLTIADQTRTVTTTVQGQMTAEGRVRLTGEIPITMSDYGIDPPTAMLGTLKTGDKVTVHFEAIAAPTSSL